MAKKLTREALERMVMQTMNESNDVNEVLGAFKDFFNVGRRAVTPSEKLPRAGAIKLGGAQGDLEQLLNMIQLDPKVPQRIKDFAVDVLVKPIPQLPTANITALPDEEAAPTAGGGGAEGYSAPTAKLDPESTPRMASLKPRMDRRPPSAYAGPEATRGSTVGKRPAAPSLSGKIKSNVPTAAQFGRVGSMKETKELEALVAEVLAEMSKKKPAKETKKPVKK